MITITIYGLDSYLVGTLSKEMSANLAKIYETSEDEINFISTENTIYHKGVDQTSWNVLVIVNAPKKVSVMQDDVANIISTQIGDLAINLAIEFYYYSSDNRYERISKDYPRYVEEKNVVEIEDEENEDDTELYDGDIFEEFNKKQQN